MQVLQSSPLTSQGSIHSHELSSPIDSQERLYEEFTYGNKKIYYCLISGCGKTFKFKSEMNRHLIIHTGQRPFQCTFTGCTKTFKRSDALVNHMKVHSYQNPLHCTVTGCSSQFTTKSALNYHLQKHQNKKDFNLSSKFSVHSKSQVSQQETVQYYHQSPAVSPSQYASQVELSQLPSLSVNDAQSIGDKDTFEFDGVLFDEFTSIECFGYNYSKAEQFENKSSSIDNVHCRSEETLSVSGSDRSQLSSTSLKRSLDYSLKNMLDTLMHENMELKKKLKCTITTLQENVQEKTQPQEDQSVDAFFKSSGEFPGAQDEINFEELMMIDFFSKQMN